MHVGYLSYNLPALLDWQGVSLSTLHVRIGMERRPVPLHVVDGGVKCLLLIYRGPARQRQHLLAKKRREFLIQFTIFQICLI